MARKTDFQIFCDKFNPIFDNKILKHFEPYNEEDWLIVADKVKENKVFTCIDYEGKCYLEPGLHYMNRLFYVVTNTPYQTKDLKRTYLY